MANGRLQSKQGQCYRAIENERLKAHLADLERRTRTRHDVTIDSLLTQLQDAIDLAPKQNNPSAIISGAMAQAKLCGFLVDRREVKKVDPVDGMDREQLIAALREQLGDLADLVLAKFELVPSGSDSAH